MTIMVCIPYDNGCYDYDAHTLYKLLWCYAYLMIMMRSADGKVALDAGAKDEEYGSAKCHSENKL